MSKLNKDILFLIFEELQDNLKSLFSCLLVNKNLCETVIPVLWRNPWRHYSSRSYLFTILISYLPSDIKDFLTNEGIQLPPFSYQSLSFDYLSFCRSINTDVIDHIVSIETSSGYKQFLLQQEFYKILMRKCPELKYLDMKSIKCQIFYFPEAITCLNSLYELKCNTSTDPSYFYGLASICRYIQKIIIFNTNTKVNHGVAKLIEVQKNLRYFEWEDDGEYLVNSLEDPYSQNFLALEKHANTLNYLKIYFKYDYLNDYDHNYTFMKDLFPKFHKLKMLKFYFPPFSNIDYEEKLRTVAYHNLESFEFNEINSIHTVACMIKNSGGYLREISIYDYFIDEDDDALNIDTLNFIRTIYENCPLVEYLTLPLFPSSDNHFNEFEKLLGTCHNLRSLYFQETKYQERDVYYAENLLKVLVKAAPANLRRINFCCEIEFSVKILEEFLEKWKGRSPISIGYFNHRGADYISLIDKYKIEGVVKYCF